MHRPSLKQPKTRKTILVDAQDPGWQVALVMTEGEKQFSLTRAVSSGRVINKFFSVTAGGEVLILATLLFLCLAEVVEAQPAPGTVIAWGDNSSGQTNIPPDLTNTVAIAAGGMQSLALRNDGTVAAWGSSLYGITNVPVDLTNAVAISAGGSFNLALKTDGRVAAWGYNSWGQTSVPSNISNVVSVAAGWAHSMALKNNGSVACWGYGSYGQTAIPTNESNFVAIAAGRWHSIGLRGDGSVVAWGYPDFINVPSNVTNVFSVAAGKRHSLALRGDGTVVGWGWNDAGQISVPEGLSNVVAIGACEDNSVALINDGTIVLWGGQTNVPADLRNVVAVATGYTHDLALVSETPAIIATQPHSTWAYAGTDVALWVGAVTKGQPSKYQWQRNGQNLDGDTNALLNFSGIQPSSTGDYQVVVGVSGSTDSVTSVVAHLEVLAQPPILQEQPQNTSAWYGKPVQFSLKAVGATPMYYQWFRSGSPIPDATNRFVQISAATLSDIGNYYCLVTNSYGDQTSSTGRLDMVEVVTWGASTHGEAAIPSGLSNVVAVSAGAMHGLALKEEGNVVEWNNASGQTNVPAALSNVTAIAAGGYFSMALKSNGTVVVWGDNSMKQTNVPAALSNVTAIAAGYQHCLALKTDGQVVVWGNTSSGLTNVPSSISNAFAIAAGQYHNLALTSDGRVVAWGNNSSGQTNVPTDLTNVVAIAAGNSHSLALKADGTVVGWGSNSSGQTNPPTGLTNVMALDGGSYFSVAVVRQPAARIVTQPRGIRMYAWETASFWVGAVGTLPLSYQWQCNGTNIDGATNASLSLTYVPYDSVGNYRCLVSNTLGTGISQPAVLTILHSTLYFVPSSLFSLNLGFHLQLDHLSGGGLVILYASTNMTDWNPIFTNPAAIGTMEFLDSDATNLPSRFYRALEY